MDVLLELGMRGNRDLDVCIKGRINTDEVLEQRRETTVRSVAGALRLNHDCSLPYTRTMQVRREAIPALD